MNEDGFLHGIGPLVAVFLAVTLFLAGIHLYIGLTSVAPEPRSRQLLVIGAAFLAGFLVRLTPLWRPVLYLLGAAFGIFLGALWLFGGVGDFLVGVVTGVATAVFVLLALYLFVREESAAVST